MAIRGEPRTVQCTDFSHFQKTQWVGRGVNSGILSHTMTQVRFLYQSSAAGMQGYCGKRFSLILPGLSLRRHGNVFSWSFQTTVFHTRNHYVAPDSRTQHCSLLPAVGSRAMGAEEYIFVPSWGSPQEESHWVPLCVRLILTLQCEMADLRG